MGVDRARAANAIDCGRGQELGWEGTVAGQMERCGVVEKEVLHHLQPEHT